MDIAVRQQVRREVSWESLLVPRGERPSLPQEERREIQRLSRESREIQRQSVENVRRIAAIKESLAWHGGADWSMPWTFYFEDRPETCFEAVGDFHIGRSGLRFSFLTALPGGLNRFMIERTDLDANRRRLYFTHADCRFELTISQSVLRGGEWISVPLVPIPGEGRSAGSHGVKGPNE